MARSSLTEERELDRLSSQQSKAELLEDEASFAAGIAIGLDLGRS